MNIRTRRGAYWAGIKDGWTGTGFGITWTEPELDHLNLWYDRGLNLGQRLRTGRTYPL